MSIIPMIGQAIIWIIMFFAIVGVIGAIRNPNEGIGKEFMLAFHQLGIILFRLPEFSPQFLLLKKSLYLSSALFLN